MISIKELTTPTELQYSTAIKAKEARLRVNHSRKKAALMTGVPEGTIRQFENTGKISLPQFIAIAHVYGNMNQLEQIFTEPKATNLEDMLNPPKKRQRGRI